MLSTCTVPPALPTMPRPVMLPLNVTVTVSNSLSTGFEYVNVIVPVPPLTETTSGFGIPGLSSLMPIVPAGNLHYAASVLIDQGASVKAVRRHLGHASATTTLDTYAHLWPESEEVTRRALGTGLQNVVSQACHDDGAANTN